MTSGTAEVRWIGVVMKILISKGETGCRRRSRLVHSLVVEFNDGESVREKEGSMIFKGAKWGDVRWCARSSNIVCRRWCLLPQIELTDKTGYLLRFDESHCCPLDYQRPFSGHCRLTDCAWHANDWVRGQIETEVTPTWIKGRLKEWEANKVAGEAFWEKTGFIGHWAAIELITISFRAMEMILNSGFDDDDEGQQLRPRIWCQ